MSYGIYIACKHSRHSRNSNTFVPEHGNGGAHPLGKHHSERSWHRLGPWRSALLLVQFTGVIIALHGSQILLWAGFYRWEYFPSWESAFYFSTAIYSTVGTRDLLLPGMWRTLGPIEGITGVLMSGLSVSFLFAIVTRLVEREGRSSPRTVRQPRQSSENTFH